ncbi:hypothetical protein CPB83DRAFT_785717 [Crepidotus variabilis]|uniref:Uncharacterized protein n=1 Tax=Crepidotus variabilis TaxID=179855 RepID=A0A9P6JT35_9AGAR|nr:hypothetical protein CPB83DRAFT_785717 [Crepidotus variabilis]
MSTWNLGANDVSEETRNFRDKLASKDGQIVAQEDRLRKQAQDLEDIKARLDEALHKLNFETKRALQLEDDLKQRSEDLRNEKIASENTQVALTNAAQKNKESSLELRDLEATLEQLSHTSDEHRARGLKLEKDKSILEARVRELETNLQNVTQLPPVAPTRLGPSRPRSSSLSNFRITTLEQDLNDFKSQLAAKETEIHQLSQQLSRAKQECNQSDNERAAAERRWQSQLDSLQAELEDKDEELEFLRTQGGENDREEELLKRIEEDGAKIDALEALCRGAADSKRLKDKIKKLELQLENEQRRLIASETKLVDAVRENEQLLDALDDARQGAAYLTSNLEQKERVIKTMEEKSSESPETPLSNDTFCLIDMDSLEPEASSQPPQPEPHAMDTDANTIGQVEKLLLAVDRLRGERDNLRRDLQFLEFESKFAIEALEQKLALSASVTTQSNHTINTLGQIKTEMDELHAQLDATTKRHAVALRCRDEYIQRLGLYSQGLAITLDHLTSESERSSYHSVELAEAKDAMKVLGEKYKVSLRYLEEMTCHRDDLLAQLQERAASADHHELRAEIDDLNGHIDDLESERDSLALQVTNLVTDLQNAQDELNSAESRYTNLQFHQLSTMTSNEATRTLRQHIEELEARVMRRTEQIGIHQHDIRRLETNLRLQEERLTEMTAELEMMAAQKDAMVEDCADAREVRDEALTRIEALEEELEANTENEVLVTELVAVVVDTTSRAREAIRRSKVEAKTIAERLLDQDIKHEAVLLQLDDRESALKTLTQLSGQYRDELERANNEVLASQSEVKAALEREEQLQGDIGRLEAQISAIHAQGHESTIRDLQRQKTELEMRLESVASVGAEQEDAQRAVVELRLQHAEALAILQERLVQSQGSVEELQIRLDSSSEDHRAVLEKNRLYLVEAEKQLADTKSTLLEHQDRQQQLETAEKAGLDRISVLRTELSKASQDFEIAVKDREFVEVAKNQLQEELEQLRTDQEGLVARLREEHDASQQELEIKLATLQGRFEEESRLLDMSKLETARLADRLQDVAECHERELEDREADLASARDEMASLEQQVQALQQEIEDIRSQLEDREMHMQTLEDEKVALQQDLTTLEAEVQKSKSLNRYLESQVKDSEHTYSTLKGDLERLREDLARSEKACKAAEVNLSLQNAQHKRETTELQRELSNLQSRPNLEGALSELEERNNEMEELLKAKCAEIEANDDRVLEMLKEKKKLSTKVESLNRKVQNLQAKLNAAKATAAPIPSAPVTASIVPAADTPPSTASSSRPRAATISIASRSSVPPSPVEPPPSLSRRPPSRAVSSSSSLSRPKTPERSRAPAPVFKARTPEQLPPPPREPLPTEVIIGRKRSAPDDFEGGENIPTQAFLPDGKDAESRTPRVRRVLSSLQSGFTPNRNQNRPTIPMPSPRRPSPPASNNHISEKTNSPFSLPPMPNSSAKPSSKRSWLGKIRGSSQAPERPSGSRTFFGGGD